MEKKEKRQNNTKIYILSFLIPALVMALSFAGLGIYPGGDFMVLTYDLKALFLSLYGYISNSGMGYDNILHSMSGALGGNYYSTFVLCVSPLDFIYKFVPVKYLPEAIYFMVLGKVGLCGLTMCTFLHKNRKYKLSGLTALILSVCYALMSYNFMYFMAPMWYDAIILLPLLALFLDEIIYGNNSSGFIALMSLCIICDYYIAYMNIIALILYALFRLSEEDITLRDRIQRFIRFAIHGIISALVSMFVLLPSILDFNRGKLSEGAVTETGDFIKNTLFDVLTSFKPQSYAGVDFNASPNIYCGTVVLVLVLFWLLYGKQNLRSRTTAFLVVVFYFASFIIGPLDRAWHGFREPVCFSVRYAYTFVFFMICFAARGVIKLSESKIKTSSLFGLLKYLCVFYTFIELYLNGSYILAGIGTECGYSLTSEYKKICDVQERLIPYDNLDDTAGYGRVISNYKYSNFDGALFGYDGISRFSSSYNYNVNMFFRDMGVNCIYHNLGEKGFTPPLASLFNARYILSYWIDMSDQYDPINKYDVYSLYENTDVLPIGYAVNSSVTDEQDEFIENPFENLNTVYTELFSSDEEPALLFIPETVEQNGESYDYSFISHRSGHYYMYVEYKYDDEDLADETEADRGYMHKKIVRKYVFDEIYDGDYGNNQYSYCVDLGYLEADDEHSLCLETSASEMGEVLIYYLDENAYKNIISCVNGAKLSKIDKSGIVMEIELEDDSDVLMTLPYEKGYNVYVDGVKTEYLAYRNALMVIPIDKGFHEISIKYIPEGLVPGLIISIVSLLVYIFICICLRKHAMRKN